MSAARKRATDGGLIGSDRCVDISGLEIIATPSRTADPEMGLLFRANGATFWNLVDSVIDDDVVSFARAQAGRIDLLGAPYQPLVERELCADGLGSGFPYQRYGQLLKQVADIAPRCVFPASCGFSYRAASLMNSRGFPMTEHRFLRDVASVDPRIQTVLLPPGRSLSVGRRIGLVRHRIPGVHPSPISATPSHDWCPDRGVPPVVDQNPKGHSTRDLKRAVGLYLEGPFLRSLRSPLQRVA